MNPPNACCRLRSSAVNTETRRSESASGSGRRNTSLTRVKIVVLAPMPRPSDSAATSVRTGLRESSRMARRRSLSTVAMAAVYAGPPAARPAL